MTSSIFVFDRKAVRQNRNRHAQAMKDHNFLIDWSMEQITTRLADIKRQFPRALQIGYRTEKIQRSRFGIENLYSFDLAENLKPDIQGDEELLPFDTQCFDLIMSPLCLHTTNDLPGTLAQIKNCLKPDGLFIGTLLGGETLYELREVMNAVELEMTGGLSPHVAPFVDMPQMGSLMQRAQFSLPVIDSEKITVTYENAFRLMDDVRKMAEGNALIERKKSFSSRSFFARVAQAYAARYSEPDGRVKATFEIIFLLGWAPHESQQKPLRPGTATNRLADALKSKEEKLPC